MSRNILVEKAYNQSDCQGLIKHALDDMQDSGYDFLYSTKQSLSKIKKEMKRNSIYLRFNCPICQLVKQKKRFTSTMGTISIWFQFRKINQKRRDPWLLIFQFQIYRMKCQNCGKYGQAQIYDSQMQIIQKKFCSIVADILDKVPPKKRTRNKNPIKVPDLKTHRHSQCEACKLRKCHYGLCPSF